MRFILTPVAALALCADGAAFSSADVDPFIGTGKAGNCYPGAQVPFGMISWSPNTTFDDYTSVPSRPGYRYDRDRIHGFTVTHLSGVGCHAAQDLPIMPVREITVAPASRRDAYSSAFSHHKEMASPGYYQVHLGDMEADAALTVSARSGVGRFKFHGDRPRGLLFQSSFSAHGITASQLQVDQAKHTLSGSITSGGFCEADPEQYSYTLHFFVVADQPFQATLWEGDVVKDGGTCGGRNSAAHLAFASPDVEIRIGLSYVSVENARENLQAETDGQDFLALRERARTLWDQRLSVLDLAGPEPLRRQAATALYHNLLQPSVFNDVDGSYVGFDDRVRQMEPDRSKYVNFSNWDTYRTTVQLQALLYPQETSLMADSLRLDEEQGAPAGLPIWGLFNNETYVMNGYSAIPWIAGAWAFGARAFDGSRMKEAMVRSALGKYPRGDAYSQFGYVPILDRPWDFSASRTLEYGIADFALSEFCLALDDPDQARFFRRRSQAGFRLLDAGSGYIRPRHEDGSWLTPFHPGSEDGFNEGNSAHYTWSIPHNLGGLIEQAGGASAIEQRADAFFAKVLVDGWNTTEPYFWVSNEPCFATPYIYHWLGKPWKTQDVIERIRHEFNATPDGLPGDDDVGAMSAYYLWLTIGLYPAIPGVGGFALSSPTADDIRLLCHGDRRVRITRESAYPSDRYIQSVTLNGVPLQGSWLSLARLLEGSENHLHFVLGHAPSSWATSPADRPPSFPAEQQDHAAQ